MLLFKEIINEEQLSINTYVESGKGTWKAVNGTLDEFKIIIGYLRKFLLSNKVRVSHQYRKDVDSRYQNFKNCVSIVNALSTYIDKCYKFCLFYWDYNENDKDSRVCIIKIHPKLAELLTQCTNGEALYIKFIFYNEFTGRNVFTGRNEFYTYVNTVTDRLDFMSFKLCSWNDEHDGRDVNQRVLMKRNEKII